MGFSSKRKDGCSALVLLVLASACLNQDAGRTTSSQREVEQQREGLLSSVGTITGLASDKTDGQPPCRGLDARLPGGTPGSFSCRELQLIGQKVLFNETGGRRDLIVCWNEGEDFLSLGLGHFIWYQKDRKGRFKESFPELLEFMRRRGTDIPVWLEDMRRSGYPWKSRHDLLNNLHLDDLIRLRHFLHDSLPVQTMFLLHRLDQALPKMMTAAAPDCRENIKYQFHHLAETPRGIYALADYVNFKGEGILESESYCGMRWGLLQVLESMQGSQRDIGALNEFAANAKRVSRRRVRNAPEGVDESKWLPVWERRIDSYVEAYDLFVQVAGDED